MVYNSKKKTMLNRIEVDSVHSLVAKIDLIYKVCEVDFYGSIHHTYGCYDILLVIIIWFISKSGYRGII